MFCPVAAMIDASSEPNLVFSGAIATRLPLSEASVLYGEFDLTRICGPIVQRARGKNSATRMWYWSMTRGINEGGVVITWMSPLPNAGTWVVASRNLNSTLYGLF